MEKPLTYSKALGQEIKKLRIENGITQSELAFVCEMDVRQIGRIERGEVSPNVESVLRICKGLNIKLSTLFNMVDDKYNV